MEDFSVEKNSEVKLPEDFPPEVQESFLTLEEFTKIFWKENKVFILGILSSSYLAVESFVKNDFSNIMAVIVFVYNVIGLLINCQNFENENFDDRKFTFFRIVPPLFQQDLYNFWATMRLIIKN